VSTFVDTVFLIAIMLRDDARHSQAAAWDKALHGTCITSEFILLELADALCTPALRASSQEMIDQVRQDPDIEVVPATPEWIERGYQLYCARPDKSWSLTDCISFEIMRERGIQDALTHDRHFEQAGFRALLRQDPPSN
jgi:uncharacterized protein